MTTRRMLTSNNAFTPEKMVLRGATALTASPAASARRLITSPNGLIQSLSVFHLLRKMLNFFSDSLSHRLKPSRSSMSSSIATLLSFWYRSTAAVQRSMNVLSGGMCEAINGARTLCTDERRTVRTANETKLTVDEFLHKTRIAPCYHGVTNVCCAHVRYKPRLGEK